MGAFIQKGGLAFLHSGEQVIPKYQVEHISDRVAAPRTVLSGAPTAPGGGGFTAEINVTQEATGREIERTMRRVAFGLRGTA